MPDPNHLVRRPGLMMALLTLLLVSLAPPGQARQLGFNREGPQLHYRWQAPDGHLRLLQLRLPESSAVPALSPWHPARADAHIYQTLLRDARQRYPDVSFRLQRRAQSWQLEFMASTQAQLQAVRQWLAPQRQRRLDDYLRQHYFMSRPDSAGAAWIQIDYSRLIQALSPEMTPLAGIIVDQPRGAPARTDTAGMRHNLALLLDFVQSIPYRTGESAGPQAGLGFLLPRELLAQNGGDCDSKVVLLASLVRGLYPQLPVNLLLVPEHALLGVALPPHAGDDTLMLAGKPLLLLEPAGPATLPPGQLGEQSRRHLAAGHYSHQAVPPSGISHERPIQ